MSAALPPPGGPRQLVPLALLTALAATVLANGPLRARADEARVITGYRIEVQACRPENCRSLPASAQRWAGRYACQARAELIERFADLSMLKQVGVKPGSWTVRARCVPVLDLRSA